MADDVYVWHTQCVIDLSRIGGFEWDEGNARKSATKHGVSSVEAEEAFRNRPLRVVPDIHHGSNESRFVALGQTNEGRKLFISFTLRGEGRLIRVISARDMSRRERATYAEATETSSDLRD